LSVEPINRLIAKCCILFGEQMDDWSLGSILRNYISAENHSGSVFILKSFGPISA
jgi:hypothetical protein